jgi:hypothetical protein
MYCIDELASASMVGVPLAGTLAAHLRIVYAFKLIRSIHQMATKILCRSDKIHGISLLNADQLLVMLAAYPLPIALERTCQLM